ncbi:unnamed protein product [Rhizophagus irregularis]|nr:unnamed protein product [Rhizophagus irregularis]
MVATATSTTSMVVTATSITSMVATATSTTSMAATTISTTSMVATATSTTSMAATTISTASITNCYHKLLALLIKPQIRLRSKRKLRIAESLPTSLHSPHLPYTRTPMDEIENELVEAGISLPEKYFVNGRYPKTSRPSARSPNELSDPSGYSSLNQQQLSSILLINSMPKWIRNFIINELKPLFLRTCHLDQSSKNRIIQDFLTILFPKFVELHPDKLNEVAKSFRKTWSYWRNMLWDKINERHRLIQKRREKSGQSVAHHLKNYHLSDIFSLWFKYTTDLVLSQEDLNSLKNLIFFAIHCIENYEDARNQFYMHNGDLYTVNNIFNSSSGLNIAASMDLSKYEINYEDYEDELIVCSSFEDEDEGQRTKGTPKKQSTNKRNI